MTREDLEIQYIDYALARERRALWTGVAATLAVFVGPAIAGGVFFWSDGGSNALLVVVSLGLIAIGGAFLWVILRALNSLRIGETVTLRGTYTREFVRSGDATRVVDSIGHRAVTLPPSWHTVLQEGEHYEGRGVRLDIDWGWFERFYLDSDRVLLLSAGDLWVGDAIEAGLGRAPKAPLLHGLFAILAIAAGALTLVITFDGIPSQHRLATLMSNLDGGIPYTAQTREASAPNQLFIQIPVFAADKGALVPAQMDARHQRIQTLLTERIEAAEGLERTLRTRRNGDLSAYTRIFGEHEAWAQVQQASKRHRGWRDPFQALLVEDLDVFERRIREILEQEFDDRDLRPNLIFSSDQYAHRLQEEVEQHIETRMLSGIITPTGRVEQIEEATRYGFLFLVICSCTLILFVLRLLRYILVTRHVMRRALPEAHAPPSS